MSQLMLVTSLDAKLYHTYPILQTFTPQDRAFDCAHIAYDCNDRTFEKEKSRF